MMTFSAANLLKNGVEIVSTDVNVFCDRYLVDVECVVREINNFSTVFQANHSMIDMSDVSVPKKAADTILTDETDQIDTPAAVDDHDDIWIRQTFLQPHRLLQLLSSFPTLLIVYKILLTVAVTSASAERAMNKVKLIKTRLRSTMSDEYFLGLMLLACEKDLCDKLAADDIINRFASVSPVLRNTWRAPRTS